jgi:hypothetical protein
MATLEVADIFRDQGPAWRRAHAGHISLDQLKVMSAIERCRSAALGGHVLCCEGSKGFDSLTRLSCIWFVARNVSCSFSIHKETKIKK